MIERRKYIRLESSISVRCLPAEIKGPPVPASTKNISIGGIRVVLKDKFNPGTKINLEITLPQQPKPLVIAGEVVWQRPEVYGNEIFNDTGIKYTDFDTPDMQRFTSYLLDCLRTKLEKTKETATESAAKIAKIFDVLCHEIRLPGDNSRSIALPDFLVHEINLPGDKVRYCRIKAAVTLKYKQSYGTEEELKSSSQYLSSSSAWLLIDNNLPKGTIVNLFIELPTCPSRISVKAQIVEILEQIRCDDKELRIYYETKADFVELTSADKKHIVRYIYSCRKDYIMLGKKLPPGWL